MFTTYAELTYPGWSQQPCTWNTPQVCYTPGGKHRRNVHIQPKLGPGAVHKLEKRIHFHKPICLMKTWRSKCYGMKCFWELKRTFILFSVTSGPDFRVSCNLEYILLVCWPVEHTSLMIIILVTSHFSTNNPTPLCIKHTVGNLVTLMWGISDAKQYPRISLTIVSWLLLYHFNSLQCK